MGYPPNRQHDYLRLGGKKRLVSAEKLAILAHGRQFCFIPSLNLYLQLLRMALDV